MILIKIISIEWRNIAKYLSLGNVWTLSYKAYEWIQNIFIWIKMENVVYKLGCHDMYLHVTKPKHICTNYFQLDKIEKVVDKLGSYGMYPHVTQPKHIQRNYFHLDKKWNNLTKKGMPRYIHARKLIHIHILTKYAMVT